MEKLVYALWRNPADDPSALAGSLVDVVGPSLLDPALGLHGVRVLSEEPAGDVLRVRGPGDGNGGVLAGAVSVWLDSYDDRGAVEERLADAGATTVHGWLVAESVPKAYGPSRTWPDGERSPGMTILTLFDKAGHVSEADFYRIWHGEHTPLTFDIHPVWLYVRNQVVRPVTPGAPSVRGVVYEAVPTDQDFTDLTRFFGCAGRPEQLGAQIDRVNAHMATFADTEGLQCAPMREWILRTLRG